MNDATIDAVKRYTIDSITEIDGKFLVTAFARGEKTATFFSPEKEFIKAHEFESLVNKMRDMQLAIRAVINNSHRFHKSCICVVCQGLHKAAGDKP